MVIKCTDVTFMIISLQCFELKSFYYESFTSEKLHCFFITMTFGIDFKFHSSLEYKLKTNC